MPEERIGIILLGFSPPFPPGILADSLRTVLSEIFPASVRLSTEILGSRPLPGRAYDERRRVCIADRTIDALSEMRDGTEKVLGLTPVRMLLDDRAQVMGAVRMDRAAAVLSVYGLDPGTIDTRTHRLFFERTVKETVHAGAHLYGMPHCSDERCLMHLSGSAIETDRKEIHFCRACRNRGKDLFR